MLSCLKKNSFRGLKKPGAAGSSIVCEGELGLQLKAWKQAALLCQDVAAVPWRVPWAWGTESGFIPVLLACTALGPTGAEALCWHLGLVVTRSTGVL